MLLKAPSPLKAVDSRSVRFNFIGVMVEPRKENLSFVPLRQVRTHKKHK